MNLIEKLGLEKCKAIVDGAPMWASGYSLQSKDYFSGNIWVESTEFYIEDLRTAIADHERTDYVSDISYHLSPLTRVTET